MNSHHKFGKLNYVREVEKSKKLNDLKQPHIIISASGMAEGGRILHHLRNNIENPRNLVLFVGYAAHYTLARKLMDGEKRVRIFGEEHNVRCKIRKMDDFSAHGDRNELIEYLKFQNPEKLKKIFLVHGEEDQAMPFQKLLTERGYPAVFYPELGEVYEI